MSTLQLLKYKGNQCAQCGMKVQEILRTYGTINRVFQFHHVDPTSKDPNYKNLIRQKLSGRQLDEVDKCVLLCSPCHGIVEGQGNNAQLEVVVLVQRKKFSQRLNGQLLRSLRRKTGTFLTNETVLVWPYWVHLGRRKPILTNGDELHKRLLIDCITKIDKHKTINIREYNRELVLSVKRLSEDQSEMKHTLRVPFMKSELFLDNGQPGAWVRNGFALTSDGEVMENAEVKLRFNHKKVPS